MVLSIRYKSVGSAGRMNVISLAGITRWLSSHMDIRSQKTKNKIHENDK